MSNLAEKESDTEIQTKEAVDQLEKKMLEYEQADCPVIHRFSPGLYIREVLIPAGVIAIGHYQKTEHLNIFLQGRVTVLNNDGTTAELKAPMIFTGQPGRKVGYIHEDVVWLNIYPTDETDVETLEEMFLDKSKGWEEAHNRMKRLERKEDVDDFHAMASEVGVSEDIIREQTDDETDQIKMPPGSYKFAISDSSIDGKGVFATAGIAPDEIVGPARIDGKRTPIGRFTNHSKSPNAQMINMGGNVYLVATREIQGCKAGELGDEITTDYRDTVKLIRDMGV